MDHEVVQVEGVQKIGACSCRHHARLSCSRGRDSGDAGVQEGVTVADIGDCVSGTLLSLIDYALSENSMQRWQRQHQPRMEVPPWVRSDRFL
jgi:hypothetical protein